jgi:hypothetical protein
MNRRIAVLITAGLAAAGVAVAIAPAAATAEGCRVDYSVPSQWSGGFTAAVTVTNLGSPLTGWTLAFDFTAGQTVMQGWNATWSQAGTRVTATNAAWNGALGTGSSASIGFNGYSPGANPVPQVFTLNGVRCDGTVTSPSPSPSLMASPSPSVSPSGGAGGLPPVVKLTSPNSTSIYGEPGTIPIAATASDPDGTVTKVEFYTAPFSGAPFTLVATDTTAPYSFSLVTTRANVFVIQAIAYDNTGLTATDSVRIHVAVSDPPPSSSP